MEKEVFHNLYDDPSRGKKKKKQESRKARKFLIVFFVLMMAYFGTGIVRAQFELYQANQEARELDEELFRLEQENQRLEQERLYVESEEYIEFKAKTELGLLKPEEAVMIFTEQDFKEDKDSEDE